LAKIPTIKEMIDFQAFKMCWRLFRVFFWLLAASHLVNYFKSYGWQPRARQKIFQRGMGANGKKTET